jgi:hypothetical protein
MQLEIIMLSEIIQTEKSKTSHALSLDVKSTPKKG